MQEREPVVLSEIKPVVQERVDSSYCFAPGVIVSTTSVLSSLGNGKTPKDTPWPLASLP